MEETASQLPQENPIQAQPSQPEVQNSSNKSLLIVVALIVIIAIVITGVFYFLPKSSKQASVSTSNNNSITESAKTITPTPVSLSNVSKAGTTNDQLDKDLQTINSDYTSLNSDSQSVDQSLSDQQTNLQ